MKLEKIITTIVTLFALYTIFTRGHIGHIDNLTRENISVVLLAVEKVLGIFLACLIPVVIAGMGFVVHFYLSHRPRRNRISRSRRAA